MTDSPPPRPRGRPVGSRDSYPRDRRYKKQPPANVVAVLMPVVQELVDAAEQNGYHNGVGRPHKRAKEEVERKISALLAAIATLIPLRDV